MKDLFEYSTPELVRMLGTRFKEYRMRCNLTQKEVSELSGVGLTTIHKFENGTAGNLSLSTFILLLKVVGQINSLDDILPELPESPYLMREDEKKRNESDTLNKTYRYDESLKIILWVKKSVAWLGMNADIFLISHIIPILSEKD